MSVWNELYGIIWHLRSSRTPMELVLATEEQILTEHFRTNCTCGRIPRHFLAWYYVAWLFPTPEVQFRCSSHIWKTISMLHVNLFLYSPLARIVFPMATVFLEPWVHLSIYLPIYLSTYLYICLSIYPPTYLCTYPSTHLPTHLPTHPSVPTFPSIMLCVSM
jgi:hypothetical protein